MNLKSPKPISRLAAVALLGATFLSQTFAASTTVSVNYGSSMSSMSSQGLGVDCAVYDNILISSTVASQLKAAGIQAMRYPGGSYADAFNWQTTTMNGGAYINTSDSFDNFMTTDVNPAGAKAIITVNYGSNPSDNGGGDPTVAAAWVKYANVTKGYGINYWEIGNEVGGNGYYANQDWEYDLHFLDQTPADRVGQSVLSPAAYGQNAVTFINDMKAQDSSIKCGVGISIPGSWPDTASPSYNQQLLSNCGNSIDFVIIHWYPGGTAAQLLQTPLQCAGIVSSTKSELSSYAGSRASQIQLLITETGAGTVTGPATALFAADDYLSWLENGVQNVDYEELHNGFLTSSDSGIADNSPAGPYYGAKMASLLAASGDTFVSASSGSTMVGVHAVKKSNGHYDVMLINRDPANNYTITVNVSSATLSSSGTLYQFGQGNFNGTYPSSGVSQSTLSGIGASSFSITVPAYTMSIVDIVPGSGGGCTPTAITPYVQINGGSWTETTSASLAAGGTVTFGPQPVSGGSWSWSGPSGFSSTARQVSISNIQTAQAGTYTATYVNSGGCSSTEAFTVTVSGSSGGGGTVANGTYKIINLNSGLALDVTGAATANSSPVEQWGYNAGNNQQWTVTSLGGGQYEIIGVGSGKSLDVYGNGTANGTAIDIYTYGGGNNQKWTLTATSNGYYRITPANATGSCLDVTGASTANGATVELWNYTGGNNQQWSFQAP